jgi:Flp pilus assembly pilin Flp
MKNLTSRKNRGQGMVEYIIIVVVVGIFCIGIFMALGKGVQAQVGHATSKLVGTTVHDKKIDSADVDQRVQTETKRKNLMKGD